MLDFAARHDSWQNTLVAWMALDAFFPHSDGYFHRSYYFHLADILLALEPFVLDFDWCSDCFQVLPSDYCFSEVPAVEKVLFADLVVPASYFFQQMLGFPCYHFWVYPEA